MAPVAPKPSARTLRHQRVTGQIHHLAPSKTFRPTAHTTDAFLSTKRDKRLIKSSTFLSRVSAAAPSSGVSKSSKKRTRRPGKKLLAASNLDSLADALPDLEADPGAGEAQQGKVRHRSLKSKKGAIKRKERVVKGEMERFGASMARMSGMEEEPVAAAAAAEDGKMEQVTDAGEVKGTANRWAALRGYISSTMEQNPAFANKS